MVQKLIIDYNRISNVQNVRLHLSKK